MGRNSAILSPVEIVQRRKRRWKLVVLLVLLLALFYYLVFVNQYVVAYKDDTQHFLYGSIGSEVSGPPYWVFKALPVIYPDKLGSDGYRRFGFLYESPDADLPIGVSRRKISGVERVWLNCSVCHVTTYRTPNSGTRKMIYGGPANNLVLQELVIFLADAGKDPGFNADTLIAAINSDKVGGDLNLLERLFYRYLVFPRVKTSFIEIGKQLDFIRRQEPWGPGRVDTFNPYKAIQFNFPMKRQNIDDPALNGASDYPSIWRQRPREGMNLHRDGNNDSVAERNLSAALGAGVLPTSVDREAIRRIAKWMLDLPAPKFPAPNCTDKSNGENGSCIDLTKVEEGRELFADYCAECHGIKTRQGYDYDTVRHPRLGRVEALSEIGTDPGRWASYTANFAAAQNLLYAGYPWRFHRFKKTGGYANQPLDGIWARSPYLHNGSVPTLRDLLEPKSERPKVWHRGSDELDRKNVGFRSDEAAPGRLFRFDTTKPGNANTGHEGERYGTNLPRSAKDALVEYMKTL